MAAGGCASGGGGAAAVAAAAELKEVAIAVEASGHKSLPRHRDPIPAS